CQQCNNYPYTF
nr:immunoglobulin light chain junction region [Macaca mulatta]MOW35458.1 immunoglobulin light chain junction region [Macaca mulatta]MOW35875.1 immunoglobulin light chain junction region [Macaca mulatta]